MSAHDHTDLSHEEVDWLLGKLGLSWAEAQALGLPGANASGRYDAAEVMLFYRSWTEIHGCPIAARRAHLAIEDARLKAGGKWRDL